MINISIYGEHAISVASVSRLLKSEALFSLQSKPSQDINKQLFNNNCDSNVAIYCVNGYSNGLYKQIKKWHSEKPSVRKVLIIPVTHKHFLKKLISVGIDAIVSYKSSAEDLIQAVRCASLNQTFLSPDLSSMIIKSKYPSCFNSLSQRELEITYLLTNGMNVKNVSSELNISPKTVNTYRYRIFSKLSIDRNIDLFRIVSREAAYMLNK